MANKPDPVAQLSALGKRGRSSDPQGPPGKIQQMDTGSEMDTTQFSSLNVEHAQTSAPVRDEVYYMEDGSCIFLVQNTLFNVRPLTFPPSLFTSEHPHIGPPLNPKQRLLLIQHNVLPPSRSPFLLLTRSRRQLRQQPYNPPRRHPLRIPPLPLGTIRTPPRTPHRHHPKRRSKSTHRHRARKQQIRIQNPRNMGTRRYPGIRKPKTVSHLVGYTSARIVHFSRSKRRKH